MSRRSEPKIAVETAIGNNYRIRHHEATKRLSLGVILMLDKTNPEKAVKELTLLLMYLTRFNEGGRFDSDLDTEWKGYDFDIINELDEENYIRQGRRSSKSVAITDEGMKLSRELLAKYNILDWK